MAEEGSESSGSSEESDVEWEDVEPAPCILNGTEKNSTLNCQLAAFCSPL